MYCQVKLLLPEILAWWHLFIEFRPEMKVGECGDSFGKIALSSRPEDTGNYFTEASLRPHSCMADCLSTRFTLNITLGPGLHV